LLFADLIIGLCDLWFSVTDYWLHVSGLIFYVQSFLLPLVFQFVFEASFQFFGLRLAFHL